MEMQRSLLPGCTAPSKGQRGAEVKKVWIEEAQARVLRLMAQIDDQSPNCTMSDVMRRMELGEAIRPEHVSAMLQSIFTQLAGVSYAIRQANGDNDPTA